MCPVRFHRLCNVDSHADVLLEASGSEFIGRGTFVHKGSIQAKNASGSLLNMESCIVQHLLEILACGSPCGCHEGDGKNMPVGSSA